MKIPCVSIRRTLIFQAVKMNFGGWRGPLILGKKILYWMFMLKLSKEDPQWRLVIAPRHIERVGQIIELITRRGFKAVKFSQMPSSMGPSEKIVVVLDTIGHLRSLYAKASLVFVGKSLCVGGGQNIIEPAF